MGVQVVVKGPNGSDIIILGKTMSVERIKDVEEVLVVRDINGAELAMVPFGNIRYTSPCSDDNIPVNTRENVGINLHIKGENGDLFQVCNLIKYVRPYETMVAELIHRYKENDQMFEQPLLSVPFPEIRYIDFNHKVEPVEEVVEVPQETNKKGPRIGMKPTPRS